jgi:hypothetical protein
VIRISSQTSPYIYPTPHYQTSCAFTLACATSTSKHVEAPRIKDLSLDFRIGCTSGSRPDGQPFVPGPAWTTIDRTDDLMCRARHANVIIECSNAGSSQRRECYLQEWWSFLQSFMGTFASAASPLLSIKASARYRTGEWLDVASFSGYSAFTNGSFFPAPPRECAGFPLVQRAEGCRLTMVVDDLPN